MWKAISRGRDSIWEKYFKYSFILVHRQYFIAIYAEDRCERYNYWKSLCLLLSWDFYFYFFLAQRRISNDCPYTKVIKWNIYIYIYKSSLVYSSFSCCWAGFYSACANVCLYLTPHKQCNNYQFLLDQFQRRDNNRFWLLMACKLKIIHCESKI